MIKCNECGAENSMTAQFCGSCGNSFSEVQEQLREADLQEAEILRSQGHSASFWLAAVAFLGAGMGAVTAFTSDPTQRTAIWIIVGFVTALFLGMALWARYQPVAASVTALVLLGSMWLLDAVVDPSTIVQGIVIKVILIVVLGRAIKAGLRFRELQREGRRG